jgi:hypothetical protein
MWAIVEGLFGLQLQINGDLSWHPRFPESWKGKKISIDEIRRGAIQLRKEF